MPSYRVARFCRFYSAELYRGASMRWPTRDGVIPCQHFFALEAEHTHVAAGEQLQQYYATLLGVAHVMGSADGRPALDRAVRELTRLACPGTADE